MTPVFARTIVGLLRQLMAAGWDEATLTRVARSHDLAIQLFGHRFRASGVPFVSHLSGTASVLAAAGAPADEVVAGLLHAAYAQGDFRDRRPPMDGSHRRQIADAAGPAAEALIHAYTHFPWPAAVHDPAAPAPLIRLRLANEIDDHWDGAMMFAAKAPRDPASRDGAAMLAAAGRFPPLDAWLAIALADRPAVPATLRRREQLSFDAPRGRTFFGR